MSSPRSSVHESSHISAKYSRRRRQSSSSRSQSPVHEISDVSRRFNRKTRISPPAPAKKSRRRQSSSSRSNSPQRPAQQRNESKSVVRDFSSSLNRRRSRRSSSPPVVNAEISEKSVNVPQPSEKTSEKPPVSSQDYNLLGKTGGAYIPPARLRQMQAKITDKSSDAYQRIAWEALKKSIHGLINKVNVANIAQVVRQLLSENIVRGRGLLVKSMITSQMASPTFTHVFSALIAVVNTKFPQIGELLLKRLINEFRKAFRRNQKDRCLTTARFLAHLVNQKVVHELIVLELLTLLLEQTTDDSVEVSVATLKECGALLSRLVPKGVSGIFDHLRRILNESECDKRIAYMIEVLFQIRRDGWKDHPTVLPELDLIDEDDQITHTLSLLDPIDPEDGLNIYRFDPEFQSNEEKYAAIRLSFLGEGEGESSGSDSASGSESDDEGEEGVQGPGEQEGNVIIDQTETNLVHLRRTIYLMLQSSISADEGAHRLLQLKIKPGEEYEVASMVLDCCAQTRSYETRYGSLAQRLCRVMLFSGDRPKPGEEKPKVDTSEPPRTYVAQFEKIFAEQYAAVHRLETAKLKNVSMFFAHLFFTDSISWGVFECIHLNERDTSSSGRIFLKYLFLELCSFMGLGKLQARLRDETLQPFFAHLLPRDNPKDTRFAINFLTTIGLGGLTIDLREHLQATKAAGEKAKLADAVEQLASSSSSSSGSSSSTSGSSSSSNSSSSASSSSSGESDDEGKKVLSDQIRRSPHHSNRSKQPPKVPRDKNAKPQGVKESKIVNRSPTQRPRRQPNSPTDGSRFHNESPPPPPSHRPRREAAKGRDVSSIASSPPPPPRRSKQVASPVVEKRTRYNSPLARARGHSRSPLSRQQRQPNGDNYTSTEVQGASRSPRRRRQPSPVVDKRRSRYKSPITERLVGNRTESPLSKRLATNTNPARNLGREDSSPSSRRRRPSPVRDQRRRNEKTARGGVSPLSQRENNAHRQWKSSKSPHSTENDRKGSPPRSYKSSRRHPSPTLHNLSPPRSSRHVVTPSERSKRHGSPGRCSSPPISKVGLSNYSPPPRRNRSPFRRGGGGGRRSPIPSH